MSSEVVKKRGRPKKVIPDSVEIELPKPSPKAKTRSKSTKAAPKAVKASTTSTKPTATTKSSIKQPIPSNSAPAKPNPSPPPLPAKVESQNPATHMQSTTKTSPPSEISEQVRELSTKNGNQTFPKKAEPSAENTMASKPSPASASTKPTTSPTAPPTNATKPSSPPSAKPASPLRIPLAEMNSEIVSRLSTRAGARPNPAGSKQLPPQYKSAARRFTATVIAIPVALVTSWVLYQRLMGEDPKNLMRPAVAKPDESRGEK